MLGVTKPQLAQLREMGKDRSVTIRVRVDCTTHFHHSVDREVESPKVVTERSGILLCTFLLCTFFLCTYLLIYLFLFFSFISIIQ